MSWRDHAACAGLSLSLFYADRGEHGNNNEAMEVCASCVVRGPCLVDALDIEVPSEVFGIRGGLTPNQRRQLLRRQVA